VWHGADPYRDVLPVMKLTVPPGSYEYQIGIVSGA
jgi:hypothetical protein